VRRRFEVDLPLPDFFEEPTIAGLAATIERLRSEGRTVYGQPLARRARPERLPLSFAQERLWFLDRLQPGSSVYNIPLALGLKGRLILPVLAASLDEVAARHEGLRTTFALAEGRPVQVIAPALRLDPAVIDLSGLPEGLRQSESKRLGVEEAALPFDLERGPLVRAALLRLTKEHHIALFTVHHIVADGWSMGVLVREVGELYRALSCGERPSLSELPVQYADFALWQRVALRTGSRRTDRLLAAQPGRGAGPAGAAHRSAPASHAELPRRQGLAGARPGSDGWNGRGPTQPRCDLVPDTAGRLPGLAGSSG
jgi:hypothetical protein